MANFLRGLDPDFKKVVKGIKSKLHQKDNRELLIKIANNGGYLTEEMMQDFKNVFGDDWIVWIKMFTGYKYCLTVGEYFKINNQEIKSLNDFKTPKAINTYKEMYEGENIDYSNYDFRRDIREVYIPADHYEYFVF
ncbi:MAG: hypothetical protein APF81_17825 [Desulfosporosinus sp. BRH_c37]|nr:MAG: hypothetical protein APF81_17825 [Desulfosporosinus sp. BRH_c37]